MVLNKPDLEKGEKKTSLYMTISKKTQSINI